MTPMSLARQVKEVSHVLQRLLDIFEQRGESTVVEGMHLSPDFILHICEKPNALVFCVDNKLSLEKRLEYKSLTRNRLAFHDLKTGHTRYGPLVMNKMRNTRYVQHGDRIEEIHREIVRHFRVRHLPVVQFTDIEAARRKIDRIIANWFKKLQVK